MKPSLMLLLCIPLSKADNPKEGGLRGGKKQYRLLETQFDHDSLRAALDEYFVNKVATEQTYGAIGDWDVSQVTSFDSLFAERTDFNEDISNWDTSKVTTMSKMFHYAQAFNQPIGDWNTSRVTNLYQTFHSAKTFNQDISNWDTSKVTGMGWTFAGASEFNQEIGTWDTSNVQDMNGMFYDAKSFNGAIDTWVASNVEDMSIMFYNAESFNQGYLCWDTGSVLPGNKGQMFSCDGGFNSVDCPPTQSPTTSPTQPPSSSPTLSPSSSPTVSPTKSPTINPICGNNKHATFTFENNKGNVKTEKCKWLLEEYRNIGKCNNENLDAGDGSLVWETCPDQCTEHSGCGGQ